MALSPEEAEHVPKLFYNEDKVDRLEEEIDKKIRREFSVSNGVCVYLWETGVKEVRDPELFELKRRYTNVGWDVHIFEFDDEHWAVYLKERSFTGDMDKCANMITYKDKIYPDPIPTKEKKADTPNR